MSTLSYIRIHSVYTCLAQSLHVSDTVVETLVLWTFPDLLLACKGNGTGAGDDDDAGTAADDVDDDDEVFASGDAEAGQLSDLVGKQNSLSHDAVQQEGNETQKTVCVLHSLFIARDVNYCNQFQTISFNY